MVAPWQKSVAEFQQGIIEWQWRGRFCMDAAARIRIMAANGLTVFSEETHGPMKAQMGLVLVNPVKWVFYHYPLLYTRLYFLLCSRSLL